MKSEDALTPLLPAISDGTIFAVVRSGLGANFRVIYFDRATQYSAGTTTAYDDTAWHVIMMQFDGGTMRIDVDGTPATVRVMNNFDARSGSTEANVEMLFATSLVGGNTNHQQFYLTSKTLPNAATMTPPVNFFANTGTNAHLLGKLDVSSPAGERHFNGELAEFLIFNSALTATQLQDVGYYLQSTYGLPGAYTALYIPEPGSCLLLLAAAASLLTMRRRRA